MKCITCGEREATETVLYLRAPENRHTTPPYGVSDQPNMCVECAREAHQRIAREWLRADSDGPPSR